MIWNGAHTRQQKTEERERSGSKQKESEEKQKQGARSKRARRRAYGPRWHGKRL